MAIPEKIKKIQNRILYVKKGRANWHPVFSINADATNANDLIVMKKSEIYKDCIQGGSCMPEFKDVIEENGKEI